MPGSDLVRHRSTVANGVRLHVAESGDVTAPPVLLLHGFPESWYSWRRQLAALAPRFHVLAPDQRGYAESDKPTTGYDLDTLADDARALIDEAGGRAHVVGHDWGGGVAWHLAMRHPDVVDRLVVINCPHPLLFLQALRMPAQLRRSWYMGFFQIPWLPQTLLLARDGALLRRLLRRSFSHPERLTEDDLEHAVRAFATPGAARAAIGWYRTAFRTAPALARFWRERPVRAPTLVLWGQDDRFLGRELCDDLPSVVPDVRVERLPGCGHFAQQDCPEEINQALLRFLST